jgi:nitroimidazol reductase NimA-like FMN-containing flavoprotein (pyridoxamine 5'-phosphate oxidase superfamily)
MRRVDKEIDDQKHIESILQESIVCHLGLAENNIPYVVPMNFAYENGCIYLHSACEGQKIDIIKKNPEVCIDVETQIAVVADKAPCDWGMKYYSVILRGRAEFIEMKEEKIKALHIIMRKYSLQNRFNFSSKSVKEVCVIRVFVNEVTGKKSGY